MSEKLDRIIDALEIIGQQQDAIVEALRPVASLQSAMGILNKSITHVDGAVRENTLALQALRKDVEHIRKHGCDRACDPDDPDTSPAVPQVRALGVVLGGE